MIGRTWDAVLFTSNDFTFEDILEKVIQDCKEKYISYKKIWELIKNYISNFGANAILGRLLVYNEETLISLIKHPEETLYDFLLKKGFMPSINGTIESAYTEHIKALFWGDEEIEEPYNFFVFESPKAYVATGVFLDLEKNIYPQINEHIDRMRSEKYFFEEEDYSDSVKTYYNVNKQEMIAFIVNNLKLILENKPTKPKFVKFEENKYTNSYSFIKIKTEIKYPTILDNGKKVAFRIYWYPKTAEQVNDDFRKKKKHPPYYLREV